jgi:hypothetical protein
VLIQSLIIDSNIDIMAVTETWHTSSTDLTLLRAAPLGYSIIDAPRPDHTGNRVNHGGIAVLYRESFVSRTTTLPLRPTTFELLICHITAAASKIILVVVYRPSTQPISETFFDQLTTLLEAVTSYHTTVIVTGDFNIHVNNASDAAAHRLLDLLDAFGLRQHISGSTHAGGHTLDLLITEASCIPTDVIVDPPGMFSDHSLITSRFELAKPAPTVQQHQILRRPRLTDYTAFLDSVRRSVLCLAHVNGRSAADLCELYHNVMRTIYDTLAPPALTTVTRRSTSPWFDGECRACCTRVRALERRYRRSRFADDYAAWSTALQEKRTLFTTKEQLYWTQKLGDCHGNSRQLWQCLNDILMRMGRPTQGNSLLTAQALSQFFIDPEHSQTAGCTKCSSSTNACMVLARSI